MRVEKTKYMFLALLLIMLVAPLVAAYDTPITIRTLAEHDAMIKVKDPYAEVNDIIESLTENSGSDGIINFIHTSNKNRIYINVIIKKDGKIVSINDKLSFDSEDYDAGESIEIYLIPGMTVDGKVMGSEEETTINETAVNETETATNETAVNETETATAEITTTETTNSEEIGQELSGGAVSEGSTSIFRDKIIYLIVAGILLILGIVAFVGRKIILDKGISLGNLSAPENIKVHKYSEIKGKLKGSEEEKEARERDQEIEKAKRKLEEARKKLDEIRERKLVEKQAEIDKLKRRNEIQDRISDYKKELEKLKSEGQ